MLLITGAGGQVGRCFADLASSFPQLSILLADSSRLDITDREGVRRFFREHPLRWCVNCAAFTAVDRAESEAKNARRVNVRGAGNLARVCAENGVRLIHLSTDYVYNSLRNVPFQETDRLGPLGVYGRTKRQGELAVSMWLPGAMILRTSWIYSVHGHNFFKTMIRLSATHPELRVVFDQTGTPTYAPDLATAIMTIILRVESGEVSEEQIAGIWNFSNEGVCSWYDFAVAIMKKTGAGSVVVPVRTHEFPTPARRPAYSVLDKCKIKTTFGIDIPHWESGLERCVSAWLLGGG